MVFKKRDWLKAIAAQDEELGRWCIRWNKGRKTPCWEIVRNDEKDPDLIGKQTITDAGQDDDIAEGKYDEMRKMAALGAALKSLGIS